MALFGGQIVYRGSTSVSTSQLRVACNLTYELEASIELTPYELFIDVKKRIAILVAISYDQMDKTERRNGGGDGGDPGNWHFIGLKGGCAVISAYYVQNRRHHSRAYVNNHLGGDKTSYANRGKWSVAVTWYTPLIGYSSAHFDYGNDYVCFF